MAMSETNDTQQLTTQSNNYVTVIPVEYPRSRGYNAQTPDYMVEQYRTHDDYIQTEDLSSSQGALYSVSQRVPPVSTTYASLCPTEGDYTSEQGGYSTLTSDWERERTISGSDVAKDGSSDVLSDKQTNGKLMVISVNKLFNNHR
ncbi:hypothetical protein ILUMI_01432 [Ignelater luminosus]|uniref:Uncharacterized protein n=1 Tax=Ignelater luminosus TaxID=2038154 RepID=A0A8K0DIJ0_IGNLU|nr:hypothetical protein ILUMI_01432 [Ignelater luminosus]